MVGKANRVRPRLLPDGFRKGWSSSLLPTANFKMVLRGSFLTVDSKPIELGGNVGFDSLLPCQFSRLPAPLASPVVANSFPSSDEGVRVGA
jgi:hypothetical protein